MASDLSLTAHVQTGRWDALRVRMKTAAAINFDLSSGHLEMATCVCPACERNMRLVGIEPNPRPGRSGELFTYECSCGEELVRNVSL
jgi:hypothetical protein